MMGGIQGIQLNTGGGILVAGEAGVGGQFSLTGGISLGIAGDPLDIGYDLIQVPINGNISRWGPDTWHYGGETGIRFDVFVTNIDLLAKIGAMHGDGDTSFTFAPTFKIGFVKDFIGLEVSPMAVSSHENVNPGRTYIGAYINLAWIAGVLTGFYQVGKKTMGGSRSDFAMPSHDEWDEFPTSFDSSGAGDYHYESTKTRTTPGGSVEITEHYEYSSSSTWDPDQEGPPPPNQEVEPSSPSPNDIMAPSKKLQVCREAAEIEEPAADERERKHEQDVYVNCMKMTKACESSLTLMTDAGPVTFPSVDVCIETSGKLAAMGYKLE
jgi:hypothetical protein